MDDLKLLGELRADAPAPDAARLDRLRRRIEVASVPRPVTRRRFWVAPSILAAATAAVGTIALLNGVERPAVSPPVIVETVPVRAEVVLRQAALVAERRRAGDAPRADQWMYRKVVVKQSGQDTPTLQEYWTRYDGAEQAFRENGGRMEGHAIEPDPDDDDLAPREYAAKLARLPTDPDALLAHVKGDRHWKVKAEDDPVGAESADARAFRVLSVYLDQQLPMPPKLEAAIFRAFAKIPGVRVDMGVHDAADRAGIGISYDGGNQRDAEGRLVSRSYVVLDAGTYRYLGRRVDNLQDDILDGEILSRKGTSYASAELARGVVEEPGQVPAQRS
ncbi:CU044_5270 family protein [Nonomuraea candida]|uniref:CU044_5270 family protein n=1 Tax=Nonomuraea candida TaxID=359159 RepID=UPI0005B8E226|nr:CU044_5270 family protein [Nonomuraea candida]